MPSHLLPALHSRSATFIHALGIGAISMIWRTLACRRVKPDAIAVCSAIAINQITRSSIGATRQFSISCAVWSTRRPCRKATLAAGRATPSYWPRVHHHSNGPGCAQCRMPVAGSLIADSTTCLNSVHVPDFEYSDQQALIYVDGPHHEGQRQKQLDSEITGRLSDAGYDVIRFRADQATWPELFERYAWLFGHAARVEPNAQLLPRRSGQGSRP